MVKGYKEYKETKIPWLQEIPSHWQTQRAKTMYAKMNRPVSENDDVVTCFRDGIVTLRKNRRTTGFTESIKEIGYQGIQEGDLVIHVMDAFAGAIGVSDSTGKGTPVYTVCTAKGDYNSYYYAFVIREMAKKGFIQSLYRGIRERSSDFRYEVFGKQLLPIPPRSEQDQIACYLDWKVSMIDKYINTKKKQIELLKEQKQAIINQAVTKGLEPKIPMKDSGIEWLGKIPEHWEAKRLKAIVSLSSHKKTGKAEQYIGLENIESWTGQYVETKGIEPDGICNVFKKGDLLFGKLRPYLAKSWIAKYDGICSSEFIVMEDCKIKPEYLQLIFFIKTFIDHINSSTYGAKMPRANWEFIGNCKLPIPPDHEQDKIVDHLYAYIQRATNFTDNAHEGILLLQEYRVRIISDVVTGKVDVQEVKIPEFLIKNEDFRYVNIADDEED